MVAVSVLMPAVRADAYLATAIESILGQSFEDFEFVIVDDSGTGEVASFARRYRDSRLQLIVNEANLGLTASLVRGSDACLGTYIARMDADDIARRDRLERQVRFLESHPNVGVVGSSVIHIDEAGRPVGRAAYPTRDLDIRWMLLLANPFAHPSVVFRRTLLAEHGLTYDLRYVTAQDFDLWHRMLAVTKGANLSEPLLEYRVGGASVTGTKRRSQLDTHDEIVFRNLLARFPGFTITRREVSFLRHVFVGGDHYQETLPDVVAICGRYRELLNEFCLAHGGAPGLWRVRARAARAILGALRHHGRLSPGSAMKLCAPLLWGGSRPA